MRLASRISQIWSKVVLSCNKQVNDRRDLISGLCDDLMINILSRLPAETAIACKLVCVQWYRLISSLDFVKVHLRRAKSTTSTFVLLMLSRIYTEPILCSIDDDHSQKGVVKREELLLFSHLGFYKLWEMRLLTSCDGMLLFQCPGKSSLVIYNPMTKEFARFNVPSSQNCCFFFDELTNEYTLLQYCVDDNLRQGSYHLYGLRTKVWTTIGTSEFLPPMRPYRDHDTGVTLSRVVCWLVLHCGESRPPKPSCSECVMVFELNTQRLYTIPHPPPICNDYDKNHYEVKLWNLEGSLGFSLINMIGGVLNIWVLKDYVNRTWDKRYVINLSAELKIGPRADIPRFDFSNIMLGGSMLVNIHNGVLVLILDLDLFIYDVRSGYVRKIKKAFNMKHQVPGGCIATGIKSRVSPTKIFE